MTRTLSIGLIGGLMFGVIIRQIALGPLIGVTLAMLVHTVRVIRAG